MSFQDQLGLGLSQCCPNQLFFSEVVTAMGTMIVGEVATATDTEAVAMVAATVVAEADIGVATTTGR